MRDCVLRGVSYTPLGHHVAALRDCTCRIRAGAWTVVAGRTGSGKSTLLLAAAGILAREGAGRLDGELTDLDRHGGASVVFQRPDDAFCCETVAEEVAFQLENEATPPAEIRRRVGEALAAVGLAAFAGHNVRRLSGGQKQRVALACALAAHAAWLILDEPCSALDPAATHEFLALVDRLRRERRLSVLQAEHRLDTVMPYADELLVLDDGGLAWAGDFAAACAEGDILRAHGLEVPGLAALCHEQGIAAAPRTPEEARDILQGEVLAPPDVQAPPRPAGEPLLRVERLSAGYHRRGPSAIRDVSWQVRSGDRWAILGPNGAGKSTLLHAVAGLAVRHAGSIVFVDAPACGLVLQDPVLMLTELTVEDEVRLGFRGRPADGAVRRWLEAIGLAERAEAPPLSLSHGERVRLALAAVAAPEPRLLLLDEPTTGQDRAHLDRLVDLLRPSDALGALAFCTHDWDTAVSLATHALVLRDGQVAFTGAMRGALRAAADGHFPDLPLPDALALRLERSVPHA